MKNIESIFDFYVKNNLYMQIEEESKIVFATLIALSDYNNEHSFDLSTVIKMILLDNVDTEKIKNKLELNNLLNIFHNLKSKESIEAQKCLETAKKLHSKGMEESINHIYGRLLLSVAIDVESNIQLDFNRLYETIIKITDYDLEKEKEVRIRYYYYNTYDVTNEYAYLISLLEKMISEKIKEIKYKTQNSFEEMYEEEKRFYRSMPILNGVLEKIKKL